MRKRRSKYRKPAPGYKKDGRIDLRCLPTIVEKRTIGKLKVEGLAFQVLHEDTSGDPPGGNYSNVPGQPPILVIDSDMRGRRAMEAVIHEALHLACPWMWETPVTQTARYVTMIMWHLGFRRVSES